MSNSKPMEALRRAREELAAECAESDEHARTLAMFGDAFEAAIGALAKLASTKHYRKKAAAAKRFVGALRSYGQASTAVERIFPDQVHAIVRMHAGVLYHEMERAGITLDAMKSVGDA